MDYRNVIPAGRKPRHELMLMATAWMLVGTLQAKGSPQQDGPCLKTRESCLGKLPLMPVLGAAVVSSDCQHVAFPSQHGLQWSVCYDGQEGERYRRVHSLTFSTFGSHFAYVGQKTQSNSVLVLDGKEGQPYEDIAPDSLKFSLDGGRYAFVIGLPFTNSLKTETGKLWAPSRVVVDGRESRNYESVATRDLLFSPDGKHLAYLASLSQVLSSNHMDVVVRDGVDSQPYQGVLDGTPVFSLDSQHLAFAAQRNGKWFVVLDAKESSPWDAVANNSVMFAPDSQRLIYRAKRGEDWFLMVGGKAFIRDENGIPQMAFLGPDNRHMALLVRRQSKDHWLVGGKLGPAFDEVTKLFFSPDSHRTIYSGQRGNQWNVVVDGVEGPPCEEVGLAPAHFSPNSRHVGYVCRRDNKYRLVLDGKEGPEYDYVASAFVFSANSEHVAFLGSHEPMPASDKQPVSTFIVVDGSESKPYAGIIPILSFVGNNTVRAIALRLNDQTADLELVRVEIKIPES